MGVPTSRKQESAAGEADSGIILARRPLPFFSPPRDDLLSATKNDK